MVDVEFGQTPLPIVHINTFTPIPTPVTAEFGEVGVVGTPEPDTKLQVPVPTAGVFPANTLAVAQIV